MYLNGHAVLQDIEKGLYWLYKAANNGYNDSVNVIWQYHKAMGNQEHYVQAVKWGAQQGVEECVAELQTI